MQRSSSSWPLIGPLQWSRYVNKQVKVVAGKDEEERRGWLLTVDPVSASLVLVDFGAAGETSVQVVMGQAVEEVLVLKDPDQETLDRLQSCFLPPRTRILDPEQLRTRRDQVRVWLDQNRVPVEQHGEELRVAAVLTVRPPYGPEDCYSANQIILDRVQKLIRSQPDRPRPDPETEPEPESDPAPTG